jgi:TRAP-type C4-dicarboxylate transport system permease small subunit
MKKWYAAALSFLLPLAARAQNLGGQMVDEAAGSKGAGFKTQSIEGAVGNVISIVLSILGVVFLVLLVYGGYNWMIARGNEELVTRAKDTIRNAIIGLILVLAAYSITFYVVQRLTEAAVAKP